MPSNKQPGGAVTELDNAQERAFLIALATEDTIWDWDLKTDRLKFSPKVAKFGYKDWAENLTIEWWQKHIHPEDREATLDSVAWAIRSGKRSFSVEYRFCKADGDFAYIYDRAFIMHDKDDVAIRAVGAMIDVTELRLMKESLRKAENQLALISRLNAMGTMGSMIAHELNQPLTAASNYIRASRRLASSGKATDAVQLIEALTAAEKNTQRAGEIVRRLRELVTKGAVHSSTAALAQLIGDSIAIGRCSDPDSKIRFRTVIEPVDLTVWVEPLQAQQVIINLVRNSVEALEDTINPEIIIRAIKRDDFAEISIQDNGSGISDDIRHGIFSAVMTGKATGMGIGLSISRTIIEAQGGEIWLESSAPSLTDFRFTLPLSPPTT